MDEMEKEFLENFLKIPDNFFAQSTTAVQQPEPTAAIQQPEPTAAVQQPEPTAAVQQPEPTAAAQPTPMTSGKRPHDVNVEIPPEQVGIKRAKKQVKVSPEPTGEEQNTTILEEMRNDIKLLVRTMQTSDLQNKVEEISMQQTRMVEVWNKHLRECGQRSNAIPTTVAEQLLPQLPSPSQSQQPAAGPLPNPYPSLQIPATPEVPIQQLLQPLNSPVDIPLPIAPRNSQRAELPSSDINQAKLKSVHDVLQKYSTLRQESKIGTLAVKLAREAIFGDDILKLCTPRGWNNMPALPQKELNHLKAVLFEQFPCFRSCPEQFEKLWATAQTSLAQACKRLRKLQ